MKKQEVICINNIYSSFASFCGGVASNSSSKGAVTSIAFPVSCIYFIFF